MSLFNQLFFSFRGKLLMAIFFISMVMLSVLTVNRIMLTKKYIYERILRRFYTIEELLHEQIMENLSQGDINGLEKLLSLALKQTAVEFVSILDAKKTVMYSTVKGITNKLNVYKDTENIKRAHGIYIKSFPLAVKGSNAGYLQIGYSLRFLAHDIKESLIWAISMDLIALFLILIIAWYVSGIILKPLSQMKDISQKIAQGDFSSKITVKYHDIIGDLGTALNEMNDQLRDFTENMQKKIEDATAHLDISNKKLQQTLNEVEAKNKELGKLNEEMDTLVRIITHDIRAPLTSIIGFCDFILTTYSNVLDNTLMDYLRKISTCANRINTLISDLLELARASRIENPFEIVNIEALLSSVLAQLDAEIAKHKAEITIPSQLPAVYCDRIKLTRVFVNLIHNALKFSSKSKVTPKISIGYADRDKYHEFSVKDNGIGVDPKNHHEIFQMFKRLHSEKEYDGTGAGLYIVRKIILDHGGDISIDSELGKGATFIFTIPKNTP